MNSTSRVYDPRELTLKPLDDKYTRRCKCGQPIHIRNSVRLCPDCYQDLIAGRAKDEATENMKGDGI
jgi:hypothetical protein